MAPVCSDPVNVRDVPFSFGAIRFKPVHDFAYSTLFQDFYAVFTRTGYSLLSIGAFTELHVLTTIGMSTCVLSSDWRLNSGLFTDASSELDSQHAPPESVQEVLLFQK
ncbi:hypothetical protein SNE40_016754 [Patella caerulea]|uniref:Uncharacterized protein n=1 Tax=Patella caerulea TaxID=87958 RepID=A0AAN8JEW9_PATCE